ncbi:hypothetical protein Pint_06370 [Pistacia integerrima]|uniref:Uncharacterized protein n=1 Tax=Pistacia integerrima TaxID=434235 RepID=A0ACC0Z7A9_9ROSI|nr:hypothetical protein Pint_06370 [Pistacia integerrima]
MEVAEELKKNFRPEFLNRIDEVIFFSGQSNSQLKEIVEIMLKQVYERLKEKNRKVEVTEKFKEEDVKEIIITAMERGL